MKWLQMSIFLFVCFVMGSAEARRGMQDQPASTNQKKHKLSAAKDFVLNIHSTIPIRTMALPKLPEPKLEDAMTAAGTGIALLAVFSFIFIAPAALYYWNVYALTSQGFGFGATLASGISGMLVGGAGMVYLLTRKKRWGWFRWTAFIIAVNLMSMGVINTFFAGFDGSPSGNLPQPLSTSRSGLTFRF